MDKKPILKFSQATPVSREKAGGPANPTANLPEPRSLKAQNELVKSRLESIEDYFAKQTALLSDAPDAMTPEKILVIEAKTFDKTLRRKFVDVLGVEWLLDAKLDDGLPDEQTEGTSYWYLTMTNQAALTRLKVAWDRYVDNEGRYGKGYRTLDGLFERIDDIRFWSAQDRLRRTGLLDNFQFRVKNQQDSMPVEIELWNRISDEENSAAVDRVRAKVNDCGGQVLSECYINEISYNTVLAELPVRTVGSFFSENSADIELLAADEVMYFRPTSQCEVGVGFENSDHISPELGDDFERDEPIIAIFDGFPLSNHEALAGKIIVDDPDEFEGQCESKSRAHGTSMASCIINGDASEEGQFRIGPIYLRPIMIPDNQHDRYGRHVERIPENYLPVDLIHRAVRRIFEGDGDEAPAAPTIKIINLSIGDRRHLFDARVSPLARLIDWLSWKYDVLFIISAGNHAENLDLRIAHGEFEQKTEDEKYEIIISAIKRESATKSLLSPAESINSLTVGALHDDASEAILPHYLLDPFKRGVTPSPINTTSWGVNKSVKPDVLLPGGRQVYRPRALTDGMNEVLSPDANSSIPFGIKTALPSSNGEMNNYGFTTGSSNATALATRKAAMIYESLEDLAEQTDGLGSMQYSVALRALLVHSADISSLDLKHYWEGNPNNDKYHITRYTGYGKLEPDLSHSCFDNQATLIINGLIKPEEGHQYSFPLPDCLDGSNYERKVIITLAWKTPIKTDSHRYRGAKLFFKPATKDEPGPLGLNSREFHHQQVRNGTVQHEILTGDNGMWFGDKNELKLIVNAMSDAIEDRELELPYTLLVTLETPKDSLPIYEEVKTALELRERRPTPVIKRV